MSSHLNNVLGIFLLFSRQNKDLLSNFLHSTNIHKFNKYLDIVPNAKDTVVKTKHTKPMLSWRLYSGTKQYSIIS